MTMRGQEEEEEEEECSVFYEISSMIIHVLKSSPLPIIPFPPPPPRPCPAAEEAGPSTSSSSSAMAARQSRQQLSPAAFASLFLGISLALMLFGSVTFVIGLILMPWVMGLVILFCFAGIVSSLSELCRSILCQTPYQNYLPAWKHCISRVVAWLIGEA